MSHQERYQNDVDRLSDRVRLVLDSLVEAPDVDSVILTYAASLLGMGFAALDTAIDPQKSNAYHEHVASQQ